MILVYDLCREYLCIILLVQNVFRKEHNLKYLWFCKFELEACEVFQLTRYLQKDRLAQVVSALAFGPFCRAILAHENWISFR